MKSIEEIRNNTDMPAIIVNDQGVITHVNKRFEIVFGWTAAEIVGEPVSIIIPRNLRSAHHLGFSRFLTTEKPTLLNRPVRLRTVRKDGQEFEAEHFIVAEDGQGQWVFGALIRPLNGGPEPR